VTVTRTYLLLISNRSTNLSFEVGWDGIDLVCCASVVPDLLHHLGLIVATNFPIAIHADVAARVRLHTSLLFKMACYHCPSLYLRVGFLTPAVVHFGQAATVRDHRQHVLAAAYVAHPERFVKGRPHPADLPQAVWINPPAKNTTARDAPGTTIVTSDDLQVDQIPDADDHSLMMTDGGATLITSPLVSQCH
jgi:hypothetical protein